MYSLIISMALSIVTGTPLVLRVAAAVLATVLVALPASRRTEESTLDSTGTTGVPALEAKSQNKKSQHPLPSGAFRQHFADTVIEHGQHLP
jgi:hypothetical protein